MAKEKGVLEPVDLKRCQAEKPNGYTFMTYGGQPGLVRCPNIPQFVVTEKAVGEDGQIGSMALCASCLAVAHNQIGDVFYVDGIEEWTAKQQDQGGA